jgi:hypothetical protein
MTYYNTITSYLDQFSTLIFDGAILVAHSQRSHICISAVVIDTAESLFDADRFTG